MPEQQTVERARRDKKQGKAPSTQAGEFVRETIEHVRAGKHGARSAKQLIAIGLSKARRAGVAVPPPRKGTVPEATRLQALRESKKYGGNGERIAPSVSQKHSARRSKASVTALKREGTAAASSLALSRQAHATARRRTVAERSLAAKKGARTRAASFNENK